MIRNWGHGGMAGIKGQQLGSRSEPGVMGGGWVGTARIDRIKTSRGVARMTREKDEDDGCLKIIQ